MVGQEYSSHNAGTGHRIAPTTSSVGSRTCRNLSQFELDDVDMEDAPGDIEDVLDAKIAEVEAGLGAVGAQQEGLQPLEGLVGREGVTQEAHSYEAYDGVITIMIMHSDCQSMIHLRAGFIA